MYASNSFSYHILRVIQAISHAQTILLNQCILIQWSNATDTGFWHFFLRYIYFFFQVTMIKLDLKEKHQVKLDHNLHLLFHYLVRSSAHENHCTSNLSNSRLKHIYTCILQPTTILFLILMPIIHIICISSSVSMGFFKHSIMV